MKLIIGFIILRVVYKVIRTIYRWVFTTHGQMALIRWSQGDFTDYD